jgi:ribonuclease HII
VVAAAVILPKNFTHELLNDSKQLTKEERNSLQEEIKGAALSWAVAEVSPEEIYKINILNASFLAMHKAIDQLTLKPELLLIDGNRFKPYQEIKFECIIKGDANYLSIAAASVLAKIYRDDLMEQLGLKYPGYGWHTNVGYPTTEHRDGIRAMGITPYHRKSFTLLPSQLELFED